MLCKGATAAMLRWISGRLGRPKANIINILVLAVLLLPLAPPPVQADTASGVTDWTALTTGLKTSPVPMIVLDFTNRSAFQSGMLGRETANAFSLALEATKKFTVVDRKEVEAALDEMGKAEPLDVSSQAQLATQMDYPFTVTGEIERAEVISAKDGTYAEVTVDAVVVSQVTRLPIAGARVTKASAPRLGYRGDKQALLSEALSTAAYELSERIVEGRMPFASVMTSEDSNSIDLRGGSMIGLQPGMRLVAVRNNTVSGLLQVTSVTPSEALCSVTENRLGVAEGDKVVPLFSLANLGNNLPKKQHNETTILAVLGAALLVALVGHAVGAGNTTGISAAAAADAALEGYTSGANIVTWAPHDNAVKYIVYRNGLNSSVPIGVVDAGVTKFVDVAVPADITGVNEEAWVGSLSVTLNPTDPVLTLTADTYTDTLSSLPIATGSTWTDAGDGTAGPFTLGFTSEATMPGQHVSYSVQTLYRDYAPGWQINGGTPANNWVLRLTKLSAASNTVTAIAPPVILKPDAANGDTLDGYFSCTEVTGATDYELQISTVSNFPEGSSTMTVPATPMTDGEGAVAYPSTSSIIAYLPPQSDVVYVRMGARVNPSVEALPRSISGAASAGYVFSTPSTFKLSEGKLLQKGLSTNIVPTAPSKTPSGRPTPTPATTRHTLLLGR